MKTILVALLFALVGCASPSEHLDSSFSSEEISSIEAGFAEWPRSSDEDLTVVRVTDANVSQHEDCLDGKVALGITSRGKGHICFFVDEIARVARETNLSYDQTLQASAAHEFGHWLGARFDNPSDPIHSPEGVVAVMHDSFQADVLTVQPADIAALP